MASHLHYAAFCVISRKTGPFFEKIGVFRGYFERFRAPSFPGKCVEPVTVRCRNGDILCKGNCPSKLTGWRIPRGRWPFSGAVQAYPGIGPALGSAPAEGRFLWENAGYGGRGSGNGFRPRDARERGRFPADKGGLFPWAGAGSGPLDAIQAPGPAWARPAFLCLIERGRAVVAPHPCPAGLVSGSAIRFSCRKRQIGAQGRGTAAPWAIFAYFSALFP